MGRHGRHSKLDGNAAAVKETLLKAAETLATHGWCQGRGYEDGKRCVTNAVGTAAMEVDEPTWMELASDAGDRLRAELENDNLIQWNDASDRTADDVIETLRRVASRL